jgi:hypothetical protein
MMSSLQQLQSKRSLDGVRKVEQEELQRFTDTVAAATRDAKGCVARIPHIHTLPLLQQLADGARLTHVRVLLLQRHHRSGERAAQRRAARH